MKMRQAACGATAMRLGARKAGGMEALQYFLDFVLHVDKYIDKLIGIFGHWSYLILFAIIFCETGLVVTPFLPGDTLLFAAGTFAAKGSFDPFLLIAILLAAAILGDAANYCIGKLFGEKLVRARRVPFFKQEYLERTHRFYEKYGAKTIVIARFVPIVRTFAPFVAGLGTMTYYRFAVYNVTGALLWVMLLVWAGYFFGTIPIVERNFTLVIYLIVLVSIMPGVIEFWRQWRRHKREAAAAKEKESPPGEGGGPGGA